LLQTKTATTSNFNITQNTIKHFHGGLYLNNSNNATVSGNTFWNVSYSNIYNSGQLNNFNNNVFYFPGNLKFGDAFDLVNANGININNNIISSSSNYGIYIMGGQNISIDNNKIVDGLSYGISIATPSTLKVNNKTLSEILSNKKLKLLSNSNIIITNNYISLNRYGLSGGIMDQLIVTGNTFIQRFSDSSIRQYWTNNDILLPSASNVTWLNNFYKEAFTQDVPGDNSNSLSFITFPQHGGVFIP
jgi:parallel beta-helix repeat protein